MKLRSIGTNKAVLTFKNGVRVFFSYETPCAAYVPGEGYKKTAAFISYTTQRHIDEWMEGAKAQVISHVDIVAYLNGGTGKHDYTPDVQAYVLRSSDLPPVFNPTAP